MNANFENGTATLISKTGIRDLIFCERNNSMGFTNELISNDDKNRIDFSEIRRPPLFRDPIPLHAWTIDRHNNVFLIWTLGGNEYEKHAEHFALWWSGDVIYMKLEHIWTGNLKSSVTSSWRLIDIKIPKHLEGKRERILQFVKDALVVYQVGGIDVPVASHIATFNF